MLALVWASGATADAGAAAAAAMLPWAATTLAASVALGSLLVAASARSWARYDWSRMPVTAPALEMLRKQAARSI